MSTDLERAQQGSPDKDFLRVFNRLCVSLREPMDPTGVKAKVYFEVLGSLTIESLVASANILAREAGRKFFPTTAEWRAVAANYARKQLEAAVQPPADRREWKVECEDCDDTGWVFHKCDGTNATGTCGRKLRYDHYAHDFVTPCHCRTYNRTYIRNHQVKREATS